MEMRREAVERNNQRRGRFGKQLPQSFVIGGEETGEPRVTMRFGRVVAGDAMPVADMRQKAGRGGIAIAINDDP